MSGKAVIDLIEERMVAQIEKLSKSGAGNPATLFGVSIILMKVIGEARKAEKEGLDAGARSIHTAGSGSFGRSSRTPLRPR